MTSPAAARTVVYRHRCHCDNANTTPARGDTGEHRFDVDGAPFPFLIAEHGAAFARHPSGIYLVSCQVYPLRVDTHEPQRIIVDLDGLLAFERVDGTRDPFPWLIAEGSLGLATDGGIVSVALTFLADHVDTDGQIEELEP